MPNLQTHAQQYQIIMRSTRSVLHTLEKRSKSVIAKRTKFKPAAVRYSWINPGINDVNDSTSPKMTASTHTTRYVITRAEIMARSN